MPSMCKYITIFQRIAFIIMLHSITKLTIKRMLWKENLNIFRGRPFVMMMTTDAFILSSSHRLLFQNNQIHRRNHYHNFDLSSLKHTDHNDDGQFIVDEDNWRNHPSLHETYIIPTITVPNQHVHYLLGKSSSTKKATSQDTYNTYSEMRNNENSTIQSMDSNNNDTPTTIIYPNLASCFDPFIEVHPRVKLVRVLSSSGNIQNESQPNHIENDEKQHMDRKAILIDPTNVIVNSKNKSHPHETTIPYVDWITNISAKLSLNDTESDPIINRISPLSLQELLPYIDEMSMNYLISKYDIQPGPFIQISIPYSQQSIHRILSKLLPVDALPPPTGFEHVGQVIHLNLKSHHLPYKKIIGSVLLDKLSPTIQTIVNKVGNVSGPYRTYPMEILATTNNIENNDINPNDEESLEQALEVTLNENGYQFKFNLSKVYWCTRLSGERLRLITSEFKPNDVIADAFCGIGALCIMASKALNCTIYANDLNPDAATYCRDNAKLNGVGSVVGGPGSLMASSSTTTTTTTTTGESTTLSTKRHIFQVTCGDAFDFIQNLGILPQGLPNHLVMNYPLDSTAFLGALRWWPNNIDDMKVEPIVHLYTFARADDENNNSNNDKMEQVQSTIVPRDAINVAIDMVAEGLLPEGGAIHRTKYRKDSLDRLGCEVNAREVRDIAPGKVVIYVSFKVTSSLIRMMQGDFLDDF